LLGVYDDKIQKLENIIKTMKDDFIDMEKKADAIVNDNYTLRKELEKKSEFI